MKLSKSILLALALLLPFGGAFAEEPSTPPTTETTPKEGGSEEEPKCD